MHKNVQLAKRWINIILGRSSVAVKQGVGKCYSKSEIRGYYNDLTGKVSPATLLDEKGIPVNITSSGMRVYSLVTIMQYALGCYDKYLLANDEDCKNSFLKLADFIMKNQEENGKWDARASIGSTKGNSSCMAQGQGCSIMLRAHILSGDYRYAHSAEKAVTFMLLPSSMGGTAIYCGNDISFEKYPPQENQASSVLNGWIFALFGLYDYILATKLPDYYRIWEQSCRTLEAKLPLYDRNFWSNYDLIGTISSPAYHSVHITLLTALSDLSSSQIMACYANKFSEYEKSPLNQIRAISTKFVQKITQPTDSFFVQ